MIRIKKQNILLLFILFIVSTVMIVSVADAGFSIRLEKDAKFSELPGGTLPTNVTFEIYRSETGATLVATQTFRFLDLVVDLPLNLRPAGNRVLRMKADFTNTDFLTKDMDLWVEMKFDGTLIGTREKLKNEAWALFSETSWVAETVVNEGVSTDMISDDAVTTDKILDNTLTSADVGFNYAGSDSKGGPAIDLDCTECVSLSELEDFTPGDDGDWTISGSNIYSSVSGNVGIGETSPTAKLHVRGLYSGITGERSRGPCIGVWCTTGYGGYFTANRAEDIAVFGQATHEGAQNYGGRFLADGITGIGVYGRATNTGTGKNYGGYFKAHGDQGVAVYGKTYGANGLAANFVGGVTIENGKLTVKSTDPWQWGTMINGVFIDAYAGDPPVVPFKLFLNSNSGENVVVPALEITGGADLSEQFDIRSTRDDLQPSPGMVVSIDPENPGDLLVSNTKYDRRVAGIISGAGGVKPGMLMGQDGTQANGANPVALTGRVYAWVDASNGSIQPGDLLTTSDTPGYAMKVEDYTKAQGAILGKAMSSLDKEKGLVLVLVTLQ